MTITTNLFIGGIDAGTLFGPKGSTTAEATGIYVGGTDLNGLLLARSQGVDCGVNTDAFVNDADLRSIFGAPTGNVPLPINGQTFTSAATSGTVACSSSTSFSANTSTWAVSGSSTPNGGGATPGASGSTPSGAVSVQYSYSLTSSSGTGSVTNGASSITTLPSSGGISVTAAASGTPSSVEGQRLISLTITFYNSSGTVISTTNISLNAIATGVS